MNACHTLNIGLFINYRGHRLAFEGHRSWWGWGEGNQKDPREDISLVIPINPSISLRRPAWLLISMHSFFGISPLRSHQMELSSCLVLSCWLVTSRWSTLGWTIRVLRGGWVNIHPLIRERPFNTGGRGDFGGGEWLIFFWPGRGVEFFLVILFS